MNKILFIVTFLIFNIPNSFSQKKVIKSDAEWKSILTPNEFYVLRKKGTEKPNTGIYNKHYKNGTYLCKACSTPLFSSKNKYNSYSGWPSFDNYIATNVKLIPDNSLRMQRIEIICSTCEGHLGHVFNDGPKNTTGKRYCVNSVSLKFINKN